MRGQRRVRLPREPLPVQVDGLAGFAVVEDHGRGKPRPLDGQGDAAAREIQGRFGGDHVAHVDRVA